MSSERPCRHEYIRIFQRKLKGLERRLVATRVWLPVGFKPGDFNHMGDAGYCFCSNCRARLYPRKTQAEKQRARLALAQGMISDGSAQAEQSEQSVEASQEMLQEVMGSTAGSMQDNVVNEETIHVEELEIESVDVQDIEAEGVKLASEDSSCDLNEEDS